MPWTDAHTFLITMSVTHKAVHHSARGQHLPVTEWRAQAKQTYTRHSTPSPITSARPLEAYHCSSKAPVSQRPWPRCKGVGLRTQAEILKINCSVRETVILRKNDVVREIYSRPQECWFYATLFYLQCSGTTKPALWMEHILPVILKELAYGPCS